MSLYHGDDGVSWTGSLVWPEFQEWAARAEGGRAGMSTVFRLGLGLDLSLSLSSLAACLGDCGACGNTGWISRYSREDEATQPPWPEYASFSPPVTARSRPEREQRSEYKQRHKQQTTMHCISSCYFILLWYFKQNNVHAITSSHIRNNKYPVSIFVLESPNPFLAQNMASSCFISNKASITLVHLFLNDKNELSIALKTGKR